MQMGTIEWCGEPREDPPGADGPARPAAYQGGWLAAQFLAPLRSATPLCPELNR